MSYSGLLTIYIVLQIVLAGAVFIHEFSGKRKEPEKNNG